MSRSVRNVNGNRNRCQKSSARHRAFAKTRNASREWSSRQRTRIQSLTEEGRDFIKPRSAITMKHPWSRKIDGKVLYVALIRAIPARLSAIHRKTRNQYSGFTWPVQSLSVVEHCYIHFQLTPAPNSNRSNGEFCLYLSIQKTHKLQEVRIVGPNDVDFYSLIYSHFSFKKHCIDTTLANEMFRD